VRFSASTSQNGCGLRATFPWSPVLAGLRPVNERTATTITGLAVRVTHLLDELQHHSNYDEDARIRGFYRPGDDKVVFWKSLND
jgi:hypothetical protein